MRKVHLRYCFVFFSLLIASCNQLNMGPSDASGSSGGVPGTVSAAGLSSDLKVTVTGADPQKYTVQFNWPSISDAAFVRIRLGNVLATVNSTQTFFTDTEVHNQTLTYSFDVLDSTRKVLQTFNKTVIVPYDHVITANNNIITAPTVIKANRVYLDPSIPWTVNDQNLTVTATEIHVKDGTNSNPAIQTFPANQPPAAQGSNGRAGGNITITATTLYGRLNIAMNGEPGGQGNQGDPIPQLPGQGRPASGYGSEDCEAEGCRCTSHGPDGGPGAPGGPGNQGYQGGTGGATGNLQINIQTYVSNEGIDPTLPTDPTPVVNVVQTPGAAGVGGPGGPGQPGQNGGPGGNQMPDDCMGGPGPQGATGPAGPNGVSGIPGINGQKCIYVGSEQISDCAQASN